MRPADEVRNLGQIEHKLADGNANAVCGLWEGVGRMRRGWEPGGKGRVENGEDRDICRERER